jgi:RNA polymerase sigma factor (sigma-70 family)
VTRSTHGHLQALPTPPATSGLGTRAPQTERELFALVYRRMYALASGAPDFDDLVQLAAEQVFRSLPSFGGRSDLRTWVYAVCYRVLMSQRRWYWRWKHRFDFESSETEHESPNPTPSALLEARQRLEILKRALARMSDKYRAVVVLYHLEEMSTAEIAQIVGCGELTVRSRLRDGRKQLQALLATDSDAVFEEDLG